MELYLDSANMKEIEKAMDLGFISGLTTTPTFMVRDGITDVDKHILELSKLVPILQIEALGNTADDIVMEAYRLITLGLSKNSTVFKIPISLEGLKACSVLQDNQIDCNIHLVYTLQQAYMAMQARAAYICPLVGRLQDQGHDAIALVSDCVNMVNRYKELSNIMFSSVRTLDHVRSAIISGAHAITVPYKILLQMAENNLTELGTQQFIRDTRLTTLRVKDVIKENLPTIGCENKLKEALVAMTSDGLGCIMVQYPGTIYSIFTDGDLRRTITTFGIEALEKEMKHFTQHAPLTIDENEFLSVAAEVFKTHKIDNLIVTREDTPIGILDIQNI